MQSQSNYLGRDVVATSYLSDCRLYATISTHCPLYSVMNGAAPCRVQRFPCKSQSELRNCVLHFSKCGHGVEKLAAHRRNRSPHASARGSWRALLNSCRRIRSTPTARGALTSSRLNWTARTGSRGWMSSKALSKISCKWFTIVQRGSMWFKEQPC